VALSLVRCHVAVRVFAGGGALCDTLVTAELGMRRGWGESEGWLVGGGGRCEEIRRGPACVRYYYLRVRVRGREVLGSSHPAGHIDLGS